MAWSIYAYIPIAWIILVIVHGLIRSAYEVGLDTSMPDISMRINEVHFDAIELRDSNTITDIAMKVSTDPQHIVMTIHRKIAFDLLNRAKMLITFTRTRDDSRQMTRIEGVLFVGRRRQ